MTEDRKITIIKQQKGDTMSPDKKPRLSNDKALQELEALDTEVGRIAKRIAALRKLLIAA
jgi:hypothetical protein